MSGNVVDHLEIEVGLRHAEEWGVVTSYDGRGRLREGKPHILTEVWNWDMTDDSVERARTVCGRTIEDVIRMDTSGTAEPCTSCVLRWEAMTDREFEVLSDDEEEMEQ